MTVNNVPTPSIFISYRHSADSELAASRLAEDLRRHFTREQVFQDFVSIDPGADFVEALERGLEICAALLVVIGPNWLGVVDDKGRRRLDLADDWVRREVAESLRRQGVRVFPVLLGDARMPGVDDLPEELRPLTRRQAFPLTVRHWANDVAELVESLQRVPGLGRPSSENTLPAGGARQEIQSPTKTVAAKAHSAGSAASPAEWVPGEVFRDGDDCPAMVVIPAGKFLMGSPQSEVGHVEREGPQHIVRIGNPFALGRYALTVGEFSRFVEASGYKTEAERNPEQGIAVFDQDTNKGGWSKGKSWRNPAFAQDDRHPVVGVSWNDAQAYVKWLGEKTGKAYRLPSEAEWEYAARARTTSARFWGDDAKQACRYANVADFSLKWAHPEWPWTIHQCGDGYAETAPVGSFEPNAFSLYDMIGNVWEWTQDCWTESYSDAAPADGSPWLKGDCGRRVVRGGAWNSKPGLARAAYRFGVEPGLRNNFTGFRLARTL